MSKPSLFFLSLLTIFFSAFSAYPEEERLTITTYYPSPYGNYREMRAQRIAIGEDYIYGSTLCWFGDTGCTDPVIDPDNDWNGQPDTDIDLVVKGNVGIGTMGPQATQDGRTIRLDVAENIVAKDIYLDSPRSGNPRWASEGGDKPRSQISSLFAGRWVYSNRNL